MLIEQSHKVRINDKCPYTLLRLQNKWFKFKKAYLTKESLKLIKRQNDELLGKIKEYSEFDRETQPDRCEPITFIFTARNWTPASILKYKK